MDAWTKNLQEPHQQCSLNSIHLEGVGEEMGREGLAVEQPWRALHVSAYGCRTQVEGRNLETAQGGGDTR